MEIEDTASRVSVGFPLSLALLFALLLLLCGLFCCCLHWDKFWCLLRSFGITSTRIQADSTSDQKPEFPFVTMKQRQVESLPVLMPGDEVPKFIAMACPCHPPNDERITVRVEKASPTPTDC